MHLKIKLNFKHKIIKTKLCLFPVTYGYTAVNIQTLKQNTADRYVTIIPALPYGCSVAQCAPENLFTNINENVNTETKYRR